MSHRIFVIVLFLNSMAFADVAPKFTYKMRAGKCLDTSGRTGSNTTGEECADLTEANYYKQNLSLRNFKGSILINANFGGAALEKTDFRGADLTGVNFFQGAKLTGALFDKYTKLPLEKSIMISMGMVESNFDNKELDEALGEAVGQKDHSKILELLKSEGDPNLCLQVSYDDDPDLEILRIGFTFGADPNFQGSYAMVQLMDKGKLTALEVFLQYGGKIDDDSGSWSPFERLVQYWDIEKSNAGNPGREKIKGIYELFRKYKRINRQLINKPMALGGGNDCRNLPLWSSRNPFVIWALIQDGAEIIANKTECTGQPLSLDYFLPRMLTLSNKHLLIDIPPNREILKNIFSHALAHGDVKITDFPQGFIGRFKTYPDGKEMEYTANFFEMSLQFGLADSSWWLEVSKILSELGVNLLAEQHRPILSIWCKSDLTVTPEVYQFWKDLGADTTAVDLDGDSVQACIAREK